MKSMIDIVIPKDNEKEFIKTAKKIGIYTLIFLYNDKKDFFKTDIKEIKIINRQLVEEKEAYKRNPKQEVAFIRSCQKNRNLIEKGKRILLFDTEKDAKKDFIHQRASGINHIMCKIGKEKGVIFGISFSMISTEKDTYKRAQIIGRVRQNLKVYNKYGVRYIFASFAKKPCQMRNQRDIIDFFENLGADTGNVKKIIKEI